MTPLAARVLAGVCATIAVLAALQADAAGEESVYREAWQRSYVNPRHPNVIKIAYFTSPYTLLDHASVYFHSDRVSITIWVRSQGQVPDSGTVRCASVRMGEPLRGRRRFDGKTHRHPHQPARLGEDFKLKSAHCPKPKVVRHHYE